MIKSLCLLFTPFIIFLAANIASCKKEKVQLVDGFNLNEIRMGTLAIDQSGTSINVPVNQSLVIAFNQTINTATVASSIQLNSASGAVELIISTLDQNKTIALAHTQDLDFNTTYTLSIASTLLSANGTAFPAKTIFFKTEQTTLHIDSLIMNGANVTNIAKPQNISRNFSATLHFDKAVNTTTINASNIRVTNGNGADAPLSFSVSEDGKTVDVQANNPLIHFEKYSLILNAAIQGLQGEPLTGGFTKIFYTEIDETPKFPIVSDNELMTTMQQQTFKYFWNFAHPVSGLARERNTSGDVCTSGGSGFGVMAILVGIERGFITRTQGIERLATIVNFLKNDAQRFHGAWSHWLNGSTGQAIPFSAQDNGADLVETSYMIQGLLTVRQYLNPLDAAENEIIQNINILWEEVEWDWFTQGGQDVLYWHWSPNYGWAMNMQIKGYNECLITYFLAAASPTHAIDASAYTSGWAVSPNFINGNSYYGISLPLGYDYGGPLFFAHYSFLGLNPNNLSDAYANYWTQNTNHTKINYQYCIANPLNNIGYGERCWGLTASDNYEGYNAHSPTNDLGVISPTAALSSMPYTPVESMEAMKFFYYTIGDKTWGEYGLYDAFSIDRGWWGDSYLAIDQGPIIIMIENHRSGLCWDLFMSAPEVNVGMDALGFSN
jgi:hypothetical protein